MASNLEYHSGFGHEFATEAVPGALPRTQNAPQQAPLGLYVEELNGTSFTAPRNVSRATWTYRIRPSTVHKPFRQIGSGLIRTGPFNETPPSPNQMRWRPMPIPSKPTDFIDGIATVGGNGDPALQTGAAIHLYAASASMTDRFFYNADGELLIVPQLGTFGLANARDFLAPVAAFEDRDGDFRVVAKYGGGLWEAEIDHSPLDIVAWRGNYVPYKYDLDRFQCINTVTFDHPDPSIYCVLASPTAVEGTSNVELGCFPPRWIVAEHTFRPPPFHRNVASEFVGLIRGQYIGKAEGFAPGSASLHNCMSGHGPDTETYDRGSSVDLKPQFLADTMTFLFETQLPVRPTKFALETDLLERDYYTHWQGLKKRFAISER